MNDVKERGWQYLLFISIVLGSFIIALMLEPAPKKAVKKQPVKSKKETEAISERKISPLEKASVPEKISSESNFESNNPSDKIEEWYKNLLTQYKNVHDYHTRNDVVIRYYRKEKDQNKIDSLKTVGFYIHERPTKSELANFETNTIYYGDSVKRGDILIVAYQLKNAGIKLQAIEHSRFGDNWKSHSLELGTDTTVLKLPELSLDTIKYIIDNNPYLKADL